MKKRKFLIGILAALSVFSMALITGCSADDIKQKIDQLKCKHEFGEVVVIEESTCSKNGKGEKTCTKCEKVEEVKLDLADHVVIVVDGVSATCTKTGLTNGTKCSVCEEVIVAQQEIPAQGHIVVKDKGYEATCLQGGLTDGEHCSRCDEVLIAQAKIPATGHNLVILEAVEPTCSMEGKTQGVWCNKCETIFTEQLSIPMLEHVDVNDDSVCDDCGFVLDYIFDDSAVYSERAVSSNETVSGKWFRFYYDKNPRLNIYFENGFDVDFLYGVGIMVYVDDSSVMIMGLKDSVTSGLANQIEYVHNVEGGYVDFFIPSNYVLTYDATNQVQFTSETSLSSVSQMDKLFVLEVK